MRVTAADADDEEEFEDDPEFRGIIEALVFASDEPLTFKQIKEILAPDEGAETSEPEEDTPGRRKRKPRLTITRVKRSIDILNDEYREQNRAFHIVEVAGGFAFQTTRDYGQWVGRLFAERSRRRLTQSALETLAIIAFRQPISKPDVEAIRGVNAEHVVKSLLERNLISIVGREDSPGRPLLYGTTKTFLKHFGLSSINDLPKPREIKDLLSSEEELAINPIEEMDPEKAAQLTRVSSQELERLIENAQLQGEEEDAEAGDSSSRVGRSNDVHDARVDAEAVSREAAPGGGESPEQGEAPVLHVRFDHDGTVESESAGEGEGEGEMIDENDVIDEDDVQDFDEREEERG